MRPEFTITSITTASACSSPIMPGSATSKGWSLSWRACGAWSVPTLSMVPSASASRTASRCSEVRSGGFTLKVVS